MTRLANATGPFFSPPRFPAPEHVLASGGREARAGLGRPGPSERAGAAVVSPSRGRN